MRRFARLYGGPAALHGVRVELLGYIAIPRMPTNRESELASPHAVVATLADHGPFKAGSIFIARIVDLALDDLGEIP